MKKIVIQTPDRCKECDYREFTDNEFPYDFCRLYLKQITCHGKPDFCKTKTMVDLGEIVNIIKSNKEHYSKEIFPEESNSVDSKSAKFARKIHDNLLEEIGKTFNIEEEELKNTG